MPTDEELANVTRTWKCGFGGITLCEDVSQWDSSNQSLYMQWIMAQRGLSECTRHLTHARRAANVAFRGNAAKWCALEELHRQLHDNIVRFEQFVMENEEKRNRARAKIAQTNAVHVMRVNQLYAARDRLQMLVGVRHKMDASVKELRMYDDFLVAVIGSDPHRYHSVADVMRQHAVLMDMRYAVTMHRMRIMDAIDKAQQDYAVLIDDVQHKLMQLNRRQVTLISRHERARERALMWETIVTHVRDVTTTKANELDAIRVAVRNLYEMMCEHEGVKLRCPTDDVVAQLKYIKQMLASLERVCKKVKT